MRRIAILSLILVVIVVFVFIEFSREDARVGTSLSEPDSVSLEQDQPATHRSKVRGKGRGKNEEPASKGPGERSSKVEHDRNSLANHRSQTQSLTGLVLDPWGQVCSGARVSGILEGETVSHFEALTDAKGQFSTTFPAFAGPMTIRASAGLAAAMKAETSITAADLVHPLTIQLAIERFTQLRILNMDRSPLVDARVLIYSEQQTQPVLTGSTNQEGEYKIVGLADGRYRCDIGLAASKTMGAVVVESRPLNIPSDEFIEVVLSDSLKPTALLEGTLSEELVRAASESGIYAGLTVTFVETRAQCNAALILDENGHFQVGPFPTGAATGLILVGRHLVTISEFHLRSGSSTDIGFIRLPQDIPVVLVVPGTDCDGSLFTLSQDGTVRESSQKNPGEDEVRFGAVTGGSKIVIECRDQSDALRSKALTVPALAVEFRVVMDW